MSLIFEFESNFLMMFWCGVVKFSGKLVYLNGRIVVEEKGFMFNNYYRYVCGNLLKVYAWN